MVFFRHLTGGLLVLWLAIGGLGCQPKLPPHQRDLKLLSRKTPLEARYKAIQRLSQYSAKAALIAPALGKQLASRHPKLRHAALASLHGLGPHIAVLHAMMKGVTSPHKRLRQQIFQTLEPWQKHLSYALKKGLQSPSTTLRQGAIQTLHRYRKLYPKLAPLVPPRLNDSDRLVRVIAATYLLQRGATSTALVGALARDFTKAPAPWKQRLDKGIWQHLEGLLLAARPQLIPRQTPTVRREATARLLLHLLQAASHTSPSKSNATAPRKQRRWRRLRQLRRRRQLRKRRQRRHQARRRRRRLARSRSSRPSSPGLRPGPGGIVRTTRGAFRADALYPPWHPRGRHVPKRKGKPYKTYKPLRWPSWYGVRQVQRGHHRQASFALIWPTIKAALADPSPHMRRAMMQMTALLAQRGLHLHGWVAAISPRMQDKTVTIRHLARQLIRRARHELPGLPQQARQRLIDAAIASLQSRRPQQRTFAQALLGWLGPQAAPALQRYLKRHNALATSMLKLLGKMGPAGFPALSAAWQRTDLSLPQRRAIMEALSQIGAPAGDITNESTPKARYAALLYKAANSGTRDELIRMYGILGLRHLPYTQTLADILKQQLKASRWSFRSAALQAIAHLGPRANALLPEVKYLRNDPHPAVQDQALQALGAIACADAEAKAAILKGLASSRHQRRIAAARALQRCPQKPKEAHKPLAAMRQAKDWRERLAALRAIGTKGPRDIGLWLHATHHRDGAFRRAIRQRLLARKSCDANLKQALAAALKQTLAAMTPLDPELAALQAPTPPVKRPAKRRPKKSHKARPKSTARTKPLPRRRHTYVPSERVLRWWRRHRHQQALLGALLGRCYRSYWPLLTRYAGLMSASLRVQAQRRWRLRLQRMTQAHKTKPALAFLHDLLARGTTPKAQAGLWGFRPLLLTDGFFIDLLKPYPGLLTAMLAHAQPQARQRALRLWGAWLLAHHPFPIRQRQKRLQRRGRVGVRLAHGSLLSKRQQRKAEGLIQRLRQDKALQGARFQRRLFALQRAILPKRRWLPLAWKALKSSSFAEVRHDAFVALRGQLPARRLWKTALTVALDPDPPLRLDALAYVLRTAPDPQLLPILVRLSSDPSPALRQLVARSLPRLIPGHKQATAALKKLRKDRDRGVQAAARRQWRRIFKQPQRTYQQQLARLLTPRRRQRRGAAYQLRRRFQSQIPKTMAWLELQMKSADATRRSHVLLALKALRHHRGVPLLKAARRDPNKRIRRLANAILAGFKVQISANNVTRLCQQIDRADTAQKLVLLRELRGIIATNWRPALPTLQRALAAPSPPVRIAALWALRPIGISALRLVKPMRADPHHRVRIVTAHVLGSMGLFARHLLQPLMRDPHPDVRAAAQTAFSQRTRPRR